MSGNSTQPSCDDLPTLAIVLKALRQSPERRWSQSDLAHAAGLSRDPVTRLESGRDVSLTTALALIRALGYQVRLEPKGPLRAADMRRLFAHVHAEADE